MILYQIRGNILPLLCFQTALSESVKETTSWISPMWQWMDDLWASNIVLVDTLTSPPNMSPTAFDINYKSEHGHCYTKLLQQLLESFWVANIRNFGLLHFVHDLMGFCSQAQFYLMHCPKNILINTTAITVYKKKKHPKIVALHDTIIKLSSTQVSVGSWCVKWSRRGPGNTNSHLCIAASLTNSNKTTEIQDV